MLESFLRGVPMLKESPRMEVSKSVNGHLLANS